MHAPLGEKLASCWPGSTGGGACIADSALGAHGHGLLGMFLAQTDLAATVGRRNTHTGFRLPWRRWGWGTELPHPPHWH